MKLEFNSSFLIIKYELIVLLSLYVFFFNPAEGAKIS